MALRVFTSSFHPQILLSTAHIADNILILGHNFDYHSSTKCGFDIMLHLIQSNSTLACETPDLLSYSYKHSTHVVYTYVHEHYCPDLVDTWTKIKMYIQCNLLSKYLGWYTPG